MKTSFNKFIYIGFILFGIYELLVLHSIGDATTYFGIALAFDPFNQEQPWKERPIWQKIVLLIHLTIVIALIGYIIGNPNNDFRKGFVEGWKTAK
jgi:amino acid transporter